MRHIAKKLLYVLGLFMIRKLGHNRLETKDDMEEKQNNSYQKRIVFRSVKTVW